MSESVQRMFAAIAPRYDLANAALSLGTHASWRRRAVRALDPRPGERILDLACGTGDLALEIARVGGPAVEVIGADFAAPMLRVAAAKAARRAARDLRVRFVEADALALPFADGDLDAAAMAFGIRNVDDPVAGLREMARVVRPGGRVIVLELGQPRAGWFARAFRLYARHVMPRLGGALTGERAAYEYLPRTQAAFPCGDRFEVMLAAAGLAPAGAWPLFGGVAWLYRAARGVARRTQP